MQTLLQDLRFALRMMRKAPGFTIVAVLALGLGIGVNTAILSTVNGFILRPLPVEKPDELAAVYWGKKSDPQVWGDFSYPNYVDLRNQNQSFSGLTAWSMITAGISASASRDASEGSRAEFVLGEAVSGNYFDVMGVKPILGRGFLSEEDRTQNTHPVVVISHKLWQQRFNADAAIVGKTMYMNGAPFTIIGVMPESFLGSKFVARLAFWVPLMMRSKFGEGTGWEANRDSTNLFLSGIRTKILWQRTKCDGQTFSLLARHAADGNQRHRPGRLLLHLVRRPADVPVSAAISTVSFANDIARQRECSGQFENCG